MDWQFPPWWHYGHELDPISFPLQVYQLGVIDGLKMMVGWLIDELLDVVEWIEGARS